MNRRKFLQASALAGAGVAFGCQTKPTARKISPNEKLNIGFVGVGGMRGGDHLAGCASENVVALCDVDSKILAHAASKHPSAARYSDYRRLLDRTDLDAIVVSTPDHTHAVITTAALESGRHLYCEKPVTHTISEARALSAKVKSSGLVTQTGNQIHSEPNYRRVVELIRAGTIGQVREVHHWAGSEWETKPLPAPEKVPADLDYDLWLGPVQSLGYSKEWVPFNWRRWWHFGGGTLTDFCCHHMDVGVWALDLGLPTRVEAEGPMPDANCVPTWMIVHYDFPARGNQPPVRLHWYSGNKRPNVPGTPDLNKWGGGSLFVGDKGMLLADYGRYVLLPEEKFRGSKPAVEHIPNSIGHHAEWIAACKGVGRPHSPLTYGCQLTEIGLLGNLAFRTGKVIDWDVAKMRARGLPEADRFIHHDYRKGWKLS